MPKIDDEHTHAVWSRIDAVVKLILENDRYLQPRRGEALGQLVVESLEKDGTSISVRTAHGYISEAKKIIRSLTKKDSIDAYHKAIRDREFLLEKLKSIPSTSLNLRTALEVMKDRDKLKGLYPNELKHSGEITVKNFDPSKFTEKGLNRILSGDALEVVMLDPDSVVRSDE